MGGPVQRTESVGSNVGTEISASGGGKVGIPLVAEGKIDAKGKLSRDNSKTITETYAPIGIDDIVAEIGGSDFVIFIDDFHYIEKKFGRQLENRSKQRLSAASEYALHLCLIAPMTWYVATRNCEGASRRST